MNHATRPLNRAEIARIRKYLAKQGNLRNIALFNYGLDVMLRSSDMLKLRVCDVMDGDKARDRLTVKQKKTSQYVVVVINDAARSAIAAWIRDSGKNSDDFVWTPKLDQHGPAMSYNAYRRQFKSWCDRAGIDGVAMSTHTMRKTKARIMFDEHIPEAVIARLLGHTTTAQTLRYIGITQEEAIEAAQTVVV